jgi:IS30 family transposase
MSEGTSRAKVGGATLGRPFGMTYHQRQEALAGKAAGEPIREIARNCNVSPRTISRS